MTGQLRVLHAISSDAFAGVERHVAQLAQAQHDAGHRVVVIGGEPSAMLSAIDRPDVIHRPAADVVHTAQEIIRWAGGDIVHVHMTAAEVAATVAPRAWRSPVVSTRHFAGRRGASIAGRTIAPVLARRVDAQIAVSRYVADHIDGPSTVVLPGVPSREGAVAPGRGKNVLVAQRLEREKRTDLALHAFAASGLRARGWRLDIAGEGSERARLEDLSRALGIADAVRFLGLRTDVAALMDMSALLLAPCPIDGLGLTVLEAMAAGLPVVAADAGGHRETLGTVPDAALYPPGRPEMAGSLLAELAENEHRRHQYGACIQAAQRSSFTLEAQRRATDAVYRSVL